jgi:hypothetical protein
MHYSTPDYETFSNRILDEVFRDKFLLSFDELDAAISRYKLDQVSLAEPPSVCHFSVQRHAMILLLFRHRK